MHKIQLVSLVSYTYIMYVGEVFSLLLDVIPIYKTIFNITFDN